MDVDFLREAYHRTRKQAAPGVDGITARDYVEDLETNLQDLHERLRSGRYQAPPVVRTWLEKDDGGRRPIGKPTFEDKIVQRAVAMLLGAVYEQDFHDFSHGFREGHGAHQALGQLTDACMQKKVGWILDADVSGFFDNLAHDWLQSFLKQRVNDGGLLRLVGKWLNAGVLEDGMLRFPDKGTPQGGVISPVLSNIFLHHVLDEWYQRDVKPRMKGRSFLIRFADDFVLGFEREDDARRVMAVLVKRFARFGLTIHPTKTTLIPFRMPPRQKPSARGNGTFEFLGFTHYWGRTRRDTWMLKRRTAKKRRRRTMKAVWVWCRDHRHRPLEEQHRVLCSKLRGHYQYFGVRCNYEQLNAVYRYVERAWRYWLNRRSHKGRRDWERYRRLLARFPLPQPRIVHSV
jgi:group II intron reverse transcriptase/maturase